MKRNQLIMLGFAALALLTTCAQKEDKSSGVVTVNGVELPYFIEGEGIPCIVVADPAIHPRALSKELRKHFKFIFLEPRIKLPCDKPVKFDKVTMDTLMDDIEQVRKALGLNKICVYGHSIFGLFALEYARRYPEHTSNVIMIGTPPKSPSDYYEESNKYWESHASNERKLVLKRNWEKLPEDTLSSLSPNDAFILEYVSNAPMGMYDPTYDCSWLLKGGYWNPEGMSHLFDVIMADYDLTRGEQITTPVFLALGRYDYVVPYYLWDDYKEKLPNFSYNLFEKSGHYPMLEEQALFDSLLIDWIEGQ